MMKDDMSIEEWLLMVEAEDEVLRIAGPTYGIGGTPPPRPDPYEGYTDEELQIEEDRAREKLRQIVAQQKGVSPQRPENLPKHGIVVSSSNVIGTSGVYASHESLK